MADVHTPAQRSFNEQYGRMADVHTPAQRSFNMSKVRSKDTKPELIVRKFLNSPERRFDPLSAPRQKTPAMAVSPTNLM